MLFTDLLNDEFDFNMKATKELIDVERKNPTLKNEWNESFIDEYKEVMVLTANQERKPITDERAIF